MSHTLHYKVSIVGALISSIAFTALAVFAIAPGETLDPVGDQNITCTGPTDVTCIINPYENLDLNSVLYLDGNGDIETDVNFTRTSNSFFVSSQIDGNPGNSNISTSFNMDSDLGTVFGNLPGIGMTYEQDDYYAFMGVVDSDYVGSQIQTKGLINLASGNDDYLSAFLLAPNGTIAISSEANNFNNSSRLQIMQDELILEHSFDDGNDNVKIKLDEDGVRFSFLDGTQSYTFPIVRGSAGQVLTDVNGDGDLSWRSAGGGSGWSLLGNALTGGEFLGTTDNNGLSIRTNNILRVGINADGRFAWGDFNSLGNSTIFELMDSARLLRFSMDPNLGSGTGNTEGAEFTVSPSGIVYNYNNNGVDYTSLEYDSSSAILSIDNNGTSCTLDPIGGNTCTSDERLKKNIAPMQDALASLKYVTPVSFNYIRGSDRNHLGFIAQNMQDYFPEIVSELPNGYLGINYAGLTPVLTRAIQELDLKVSLLESQTTSSGGFSLASLHTVIKNFLGDIGNGIQSIFAKKITTEELCVEDVCVTRNQFLQMVENNTATSSRQQDENDNINDEEIDEENPEESLDEEVDDREENIDKEIIFEEETSDETEITIDENEITQDEEPEESLDQEADDIQDENTEETLE